MAWTRTLFILPVLLHVLSLSGCGRHPSRGPHVQDGEDWLSWSVERRESFVKDFLDGYLYGALDTCARSGTLFRGEKEQLSQAEIAVSQDVSARCQARLDGFSKFKTSENRPTDVSGYTVPMTMFYSNHPDKRHLPIVAQLLGLRDSTYDEAVSIYEKADLKSAK